MASLALRQTTRQLVIASQTTRLLVHKTTSGAVAGTTDRAKPAQSSWLVAHSLSIHSILSILSIHSIHKVSL